MNDYEVLVTEVLERKVKVKAETMAAAVSTVKKMHEKEEVVLDADDFSRVDFTIVI